MSFGPSAATDPLKLWILTGMIESPLSMSVYFDKDPGRSLNIRDFPIVTAREMGDAIEGLFKSGLIRSRRGRNLLPNPDRRELDGWLTLKEDPNDYLIVEATDSGGRLWEHECSADWSRFLNSRGCRAVEENGDLYFPYMHFEGSDLSRLVEYATEDVPHLGLDFERMRFRELRPWNATYWKLLPAGYRFTWKYRREKESEGSCALRFLRRSVTRQFMKWFEDPPHCP